MGQNLSPGYGPRVSWSLVSICEGKPFWAPVFAPHPFVRPVLESLWPNGRNGENSRGTFPILSRNTFRNREKTDPVFDQNDG